MPASDSPAIVVARFLKANNYERTLEAFLEEAGLPLDAGNIQEDALTIEKVLEEKKLFDLSLKYEKHGINDSAGWTTLCPSQPTVVSLPEAANILSVSVQPVCLRNGEATVALLATTAGRRVSILQVNDGSPSLLKNLSPQDSPILSWTPIRDGTLSIGTAMSGQVVLFDNASQSVLSERRDHIKAVTYTRAPSQEIYIATAGWDAQVHLYTLLQSSVSAPPSLRPPIATLKLPSNPEDLFFHPSPTPADPDRLILVLTRRDSTQLHYYQVLPHGASHAARGQTLEFLGAQNLAPHASAWSAFSCSAAIPCPTDPSLVAVATSSIPYLKLILARLLIPPAPASAAASLPDASAPAVPTILPAPYLSGEPSGRTQAEQSRAALAQQETFARAIQLHVSTQAPQTPYSTPRVAWRPDGSGLWVNGDDGVVRGVERRSGKVICVLKGGHEAGIKVRDLWAGWVDVGGDGDSAEEGKEKRREEWVVSGGFDRRVVVWRVPERVPG